MKIEQWIEAKNKLAHFKKLESKLRIEILEQAFPNAGAGTANLQVGPYAIKGTFRNNVALDIDKFLDMEANLSTAERACVKFKPTLIPAELKELEDYQRVYLDECITIKPGMPSLIIERDD